jgi:hypothetical protein
MCFCDKFTCGGGVASYSHVGLGGCELPEETMMDGLLRCSMNVMPAV